MVPSFAERFGARPAKDKSDREKHFIAGRVSTFIKESR
jgi:hypothetical protein